MPYKSDNDERCDCIRSTKAQCLIKVIMMSVVTAVYQQSSGIVCLSQKAGGFAGPAVWWSLGEE